MKIIRLNEKVMCVKYTTVVENNENRTKVESMGTIKAQISHEGKGIFVYFHILDKELILQSKNLIWLRSDGTRTSLIPSLDMVYENQKIMKLRTISLYERQIGSSSYCKEILKGEIDVA